MLPNPLHPAVVHFPVVLAFLLPISAIAAIWTIRKGARVTRAWVVPLAIAGTLALSAWVSAETGESQEEKVEEVVAEAPMHAHEEAAGLFVTGSAVLLLITVAGLVKGVAGRIGRVATAIGAIGLVGGAAYVGHTGGELVYTHGAASAYTGTRVQNDIPASLTRNDGERDSD
jgi:uncharacterized membrane protein